MTLRDEIIDNWPCTVTLSCGVCGDVVFDSKGRIIQDGKMVYNMVARNLMEHADYTMHGSFDVCIVAKSIPGPVNVTVKR